MGALESASEAFEEIVNSASESIREIVNIDCKVMLMGGVVSVDVTQAFKEDVGTANEALAVLIRKKFL